jgi:hypothetical protein
MLVLIIYQIFGPGNVGIDLMNVAVVLICCEAFRVYGAGMSLNLIKLIAFVLLNHHVNGFLSILKVELVELPSVLFFVFTLLFLISS